MQDLFDVQVNTMHHKNAVDTEVAAAESIAPRVTGLRLAVLQELYKAYRFGFTGEQVSNNTGEWLYSVKPRITELVRIGMVEDSGDRVKNSRNRNEVVWKITDKGKEFIDDRN
jgi:hypothetical protein